MYIYISERRKFKREWGERKSSERMMRDKLKRESEKNEWVFEEEKKKKSSIEIIRESEMWESDAREGDEGNWWERELKSFDIITEKIIFCFYKQKKVVLWD